MPSPYSRKVLLISIHALREESDLGTIHAGIQCFDFNPRPPRGERLSVFQPVAGIEKISIHALREESDSE